MDVFFNVRLFNVQFPYIICKNKIYQAFPKLFIKNKLERKSSIKNQNKITREFMSLISKQVSYYLINFNRFNRRARICEWKP